MTAFYLSPPLRGRRMPCCLTRCVTDAQVAGEKWVVTSFETVDPRHTHHTGVLVDGELVVLGRMDLTGVTHPDVG